jgi:hypothetical protein
VFSLQVAKPSTQKFRQQKDFVGLSHYKCPEADQRSARFGQHYRPGLSSPLHSAHVCVTCSPYIALPHVNERAAVEPVLTTTCDNSQWEKKDTSGGFFEDQRSLFLNPPLISMAPSWSHACPL